MREVMVGIVFGVMTALTFLQAVSWASPNDDYDFCIVDGEVVSKCLIGVCEE